MNPTPSAPTQLGRARWTAVGGAILVVAVSMGIGFWSSFSNLEHAAQLHGWAHPERLPLAIDTPIVAFVILDAVAVSLGARSRWLHYVAWGLAGFTVWANAAVAPDYGTAWRVIYAAMPGLWVLGVEALRFLIKLWRNGPGQRADRIPSGRWLANPYTAAKLQRRMWLLGETSWARMSLTEDARQYALDLIGAAQKQGREVPDLLRSRARSGRLPEAVLARIDAALSFGGNAGVEQSVQDWVASLMVLPELVSADLRKAAQATVSATVPEAVTAGPPTPVEPTAERTPRPRRERTPNYDRKPTPAAVRKMTGADLAPYVKAWVNAGHKPTVKGVVDWFRVGEPKAKTALTEAGFLGEDAQLIDLAAANARS